MFATDGAFKIRGAYNAAAPIAEEERRQGVWTVGAGNAAREVALAARKNRCPMQGTRDGHRPAVKLDAVRRLNA
jgi:threonine dehydratase